MMALHLRMQSAYEAIWLTPSPRYTFDAGPVLGQCWSALAQYHSGVGKLARLSKLESCRSLSRRVTHGGHLYHVVCCHRSQEVTFMYMVKESHHLMAHAQSNDAWWLGSLIGGSCDQTDQSQPSLLAWPHYEDIRHGSAAGYDHEITRDDGCCEISRELLIITSSGIRHA